jgi:DNA-binding beta-propeller fold protein YncE
MRPSIFSWPRLCKIKFIGTPLAAACVLAFASTGRGSQLKHQLPDGRVVAPVGKVISTANFAVGVVRQHGTIIVESAGASALSSLQGYNGKLHPNMVLHFVKYRRVWGRLKLPNIITDQNLFQSVVKGPYGMIYAAGGVSDNLLAIKVTRDELKIIRKFPLAGQSFSASQYPYQYQGPPGPPLFYPDSAAISGRFAFVTGLLSNSLAKIDLRSGQTRYTNAGSYPYEVVTAGRYAVVTDWGADSVRFIRKSNLKTMAVVHLGPPTGPHNRLPGIHPTAVAYDAHQHSVWVACANADTISEINIKTFKVVRIISDLPYRHAPPGTFPDALSVWHHELFACNAGNDDVAIFNTSTGKPLGLIPTGWYPTDATISYGKLLITSAKGVGFGPNPQGKWIGDCIPGSLQVISLKSLPRQLPRWTHAALADLRMTPADRARLAATNAKAEAWLHRHIHHVVFILRENKTFDEDFGTYSRAGKWADAKLDLYDHRELPNLYTLANRFGLMVNYKVDGEVTAQGHQWTTAGEDGDFVQRTWPMYYSGRGLSESPGWTQPLVGQAFNSTDGFGGTDNPYSDYANLTTLGRWANPWISYPDGMFIFNDCLRHHVSFEDFGEFVSRSEMGNISAAMQKHLALKFPGWNRFLLDTYRAKIVKRFIKKHSTDLPTMMYIWLPDDHTAGRSAGYYTPDYYVANNDEATGEIVAALSKLKSWRHTVIFITEDDAQSGADHISAHRSFALVVSPWVKKGILIDHPYSQVNILRTIEAIAGVPPMSQWDANAQVIHGIWAKTPDMSPYHPRAIRVKMAVNPGAVSPGLAARLDAGRQGHWLSPAWLKAHPVPAGKLSAYSPTSLLKVPGPEQLKQEWIASKGRASYERLLAYVDTLAKQRHESVYQIIASDGQ